MGNSDLRKLLHALALLTWIVGLAQDVEEDRWGAFAVAVVLHLLAEATGDDPEEAVA